jgi:hypothetical protein
VGAEEDDAARATGAQTTTSGKASLPTANRCLRNGGRNDDYGPISLKDLPIFIEKGAKVDRNIALKCAIKVCRHFLKRYSQYHHIGNVDAYIEDWKDELREG